MEGGSSGRAEAQRCLEIAEKLLSVRDLIGSKNFAVRAQKADPFLDGIEQILAIVDVLLAAEKRINNHLDWYAILQIGCQSNDLELIKKKYRKLALLLHPDKNKSAFADDAFKLVVDAWAVLSNPSKKPLYDNELNLFSKIVSNHNLQQQQPVKPTPRNRKRKAPKEQIFNSASNRTPSLMSTFWTTCPYCYNLYEYPRIYEECCLRCEKCKRAFQAVMVNSVPPAVPGEEEFFYCWGFFPLAFSDSKSGGGKPKFPSFSSWTSSSPPMYPPNLQPGGNRSSTDKNAGFPNWMPFSSMFTPQSQAEGIRNATGGNDDSSVDIIDKGNFPTQVKVRPVSNEKSGEPEEKVNNRDRNSPGKAKKGGGDGDGRMEVPKVATARLQRKKTVAKRTQKQMGRGPQVKKVENRSTRKLGKLDLNGKVGCEVEDSEPGEGTDAGSGNENVATGIGFYEGLDDLLGNMPILNVVDDGGKVEGGDA
ncbi:uncharacterized protein LOC122075726 [Macadamia integrifolia]|uniref:uncharacterized protein LOC122075726 n=1 Tax=Macadamia integrifolia TaxID=60698 RepID=UPI001C4FAB01|nr:uncharacterized protein LOC122075726 [Macadamia integrifolia]